MKVSTELGYMKVPKNTLVDINKLKGLPKNKQVIVTTGSQGEEMSALYRMPSPPTSRWRSAPVTR